ncbi:sugar ABC transporter ATP-binding protein [Archangium violaceum]|uniref:ATP-binding cassette domain-containing protein n=1 Tax=Archangium violaceum TaxID=83451 RepID=UPI00193B0F06|nr:ATP-binding cassette domain-containing protein [Archangium violaceum]QRK08299.1 sugar ABC transporter ATP-binding protein [Archangium violaceum]
MPSTALLELKGISKRFGAVQALSQVDFETYPGEVVALVGDNGAGKSTLIKIISGILPIDEGQAFFEGKPVTLDGPKSASGLGIATVYQDLALCDNLDVVGNLFLGRELKSRGLGGMLGWLDETAMEQEATELLQKLAVSIPSVRTQVAALSGGQRQSIAVARSMMGSPKMVLLDEPTAALGVAQTRQVLDLIRRLREQGLGVVVISHNLADVFSVADRIIVMRLGRRVATFDVKSAKEVEVVSAITGLRAAEVSHSVAKEAR